MDADFLGPPLRVEILEVAHEWARDKEVEMPEELNATLTLGDMAGLVSDPMRVAVTAEASPEEKRDVAGTKIEGTALTGADSGC